MAHAYDAIVVGSGPNGLAAAITLARAGKSVLVREAAETVGGGLRSAEITLPGFVHDRCASVHAMVPVSPFFRELPLDGFGMELVEPPIAFAHPLDDGSAALVYRSVEQTAETLGPDGAAYRKRLGPIVRDAEAIFDQALGPIKLPKHPLTIARFGMSALRSAHALADAWFTTPLARAMFAGAAAHSILPLEESASAAFGLMMCLTAHAGGWPIARGGSQRVADALVAYLRSLGGEIVVRAPVETLDGLPPSRAVLLDVTPRQVLKLAGDRLPSGYRDRLSRYRYGPGAFKVDWALSAPIPWRNAQVAKAGTVHLGGTLDQISTSERDVWDGRHPQRPFVLLVQPSLFDASRAPNAQHTAWAYCHVPNGSTVPMTDAIEAQVERFAPGFKDVVLARTATDTAGMEQHNANLVGGDIAGGANVLSQLIARPVLRRNPYATPERGLYLCSASTPPGAGVHGMCGYHAARAALRDVLRWGKRKPAGSCARRLRDAVRFV